MMTRDRENNGLLDAIDSALLLVIKGALWFPLVYLPRQLQRAFPIAVKSVRIMALLAVWAAMVFGPLALLDEVDELFVAVIVGWTVMALIGSAIGVLRLRRPAHTKPAKPGDLAEAYV